MITLYDVSMTLAFVTIFLGVHLVFNNLRQILLWSCKLWSTCIIWSILWVFTKLDHLPEWNAALEESVSNIAQWVRTMGVGMTPGTAGEL